MKAVVCHKFGPYKNIVIEDWPAPTPASNEVCVAPQAWGLNYVDVIMVGGTYQFRPELPFVPGGEAAGYVMAVGAEVDDVRLRLPERSRAHEHDGGHDGRHAL